MQNTIDRINLLANNCINVMANNDKVDFKNFANSVKRIERIKLNTFRKISEADSALDIKKAINYFECKVNLEKTIAVGNTKKSTGELTEE